MRLSMSDDDNLIEPENEDDLYTEFVTYRLDGEGIIGLKADDIGTFRLYETVDESGKVFWRLQCGNKYFRLYPTAKGLFSIRPKLTIIDEQDFPAA